MQQVLRLATVSMCMLAATVASADVITDWNVKTIELSRSAQFSGNAQARALAMVHVAMSDAVNSVKGRFARYATGAPMVPAASPEAAASAAARTVLLSLFEPQKGKIEEAFAEAMKAVPQGDSKAQGIALGERIAALVLADRASDGVSAPDTYRPLATPGVWIPTTPPIMEQFARVKPWVLTSADQFRPGPPPTLTSEAYARDYNETKSLGGTRSTARTAEQTALVRFWPTPALAPGWQSAARQLAAAKELPLDECARFFALINMASANSFITDWDAKFTYNFWRPVTAIRNGDQDGNDTTERDASWTPLAPTPLHPEYPSQAAISAGVMLGVMELVLGSDLKTPIVISDPSNPAVKRTLTVGQIAEEHNNIRVWGGIHFRTSLVVATDMGRKIAAYMVDNAIKPVR